MQENNLPGGDLVSASKDVGHIPRVPRFASPWWAVALIGLGYAGYFKASQPFTYLPVDLTLLLAVTCGLGLVVQVLRGNQLEGRALTAVLVLWAVFAIGAAMILGDEIEGAKVAQLGTVTLLCAMAPCFLLGSHQARTWWLGSTMAFAAMMAGATILMPDPVALAEQGRLNLNSATTIGTSRVIGAGVLMAIIFGLTRAHRRSLWWGAAALGTAALIAVGSRGPVVALVAAIVAVVLLARIFRGKRARAIGLGAATIAALALALLTSTSPSASRILLFFTGEQSDAAREFLLRTALAGIIDHPLGTGWGGFNNLQLIELSYGGQAVYPHNLTVEIMLEGGWLAGAVFIVLACLSIYGYIRASHLPETVALLGLGIYWLVVAQTSSDINGNRMTWIMLTLGLMMTVSNDEPIAIGRGQLPWVRHRVPRAGMDPN